MSSHRQNYIPPRQEQRGIGFKTRVIFLTVLCIVFIVEFAAGSFAFD